MATTIGADLGLSHALVGLLATVPVICMGIFAPAGPLLARRLGPRGAMALALVGICLFGIGRAFAIEAVWFLIATLGIGIATGVAGALPSVITKTHAPRHAGLPGGATSAGIIAGAVVSAAVVVPLSNVMGGWRPALALLAGVGFVTTVAFYGLLPADRMDEPAVVPRGQRRPRLAWLLALAFGLQAIVYWGGSTWIAGAYVERGWSTAAAGSLVAILNGGALIASLLVAAFTDRAGPRQLQIQLAAIVIVAATAGLTLVSDLAVVWTVLLGLGLGAIFPLLLIYTLDVTGDPARAGWLTAFMLLVGYAIAGIGPVGLGAIRDLSGSFVPTMAVMTIVSAILLVVVRELRSAEAGSRVRSTG